MKLILTILIIMMLLITSCQNKNSLFGVEVDVGIQLSIKSQEGVDLLNPKNSEHIEESQIRITHLVNGTLQKVFDSDMDSPYGFVLFEHSTEYRIRIFGYDSPLEEYPTTYIRWNEMDSDTLKYQVVRKNNGSYTSISKVWFNGAEVWSQEVDNDHRHFEIIK